jgi:hypothetical protein
LQRRTNLKDPGAKFWNTLDADLAEICTEAKGSAKMVAKYVSICWFGTYDINKIGVKDYEITETVVNDFQ